MIASEFCPTAFVLIQTDGCVSKDKISKPYLTFTSKGDVEYTV